MIRSLVAASLLISISGAITLEDIDSKPPSRAKNFMIWQYFQQDITPRQADQAFYQILDVSRKLFLSYAKKSNDETVLYTAKCWRLNAEQVMKTKAHDCATIALTPYMASTLTISQRDELAKRFEGEPQEKWLRMMADPALFENTETYDPKLVLSVINRAGRDFRRKHFNKRFSAAYVQKLSKTSGFSSMVKSVVTDAKMQRLQRALLLVDGSGSDAQTNFFLALNQLQFAQNKAALQHLETVYEKSYFRMDKDKALFWQFQVSKDPKVLEKLAESVDINIYSLYAKELTKQNVDNYFTTLKTTPDNAGVNISDPFVWKDILDEIKSTPREELFDLAHKYQSKDMLPVQAFIIERAYGYKIHNFILPYFSYMENLNNDQKAIMLSLMKQESRFVPASLSRSFALGLMQLMPFLVKALDKEFTQPRESLGEMFEAEKNIAYSIKHLDWLENRVYHPLFIAYAYNGGIGFTKRHLLSGAFRSGKYEPFFSMEMMANAESREYGKKVLANYVIYKKILGEEISIVHLFDSLTQPSRTDRFRK